MTSVPAEDLEPGHYVRDPDWQDHYATVAEVKPKTTHTVRVFWDDEASCIHPNRAQFTIWHEDMDRYDRGLAVDGSVPSPEAIRRTQQARQDEATYRLLAARLGVPPEPPEGS